MCLNFFIDLYYESLNDVKYPKITVQHYCRSVPKLGRVPLDVRTFFTNPAASEIQKIVEALKGSDDEKALAALTFVHDNIQYVHDWQQFGLAEFWMVAEESLFTKKGDCDDGAILLANILVAAGIPGWKVRLTAGWTFDHHGHCYVTYFCSKTRRWVALDWCFHFDRVPIRHRPDYKQSQIYGEVWFSWTRDQAYGKLEELV